MQSGAASFLIGWVIGATIGAVLDIMDVLPPTASRWSLLSLSLFSRSFLLVWFEIFEAVFAKERLPVFLVERIEIRAAVPCWKSLGKWSAGTVFPWHLATWEEFHSWQDRFVPHRAPVSGYECMDGNCQRGIWIRCFGFFGSAIGLFASPYAPSFFAGTHMCFLDVVSINQVDPELMDRGIYGLGGFLAASSELRILWSPPYLSRLAVQTCEGGEQILADANGND